MLKKLSFHKHDEKTQFFIIENVEQFVPCKHDASLMALLHTSDCNTFIYCQYQLLVKRLFLVTMSFGVRTVQRYHKFRPLKKWNSN